ncbi:MAG TPA: glycosyltransferase family protein [Terriglobales bacterium]|nr:glycosyltransferase family protein [Terriglobales bacterium]
MNVVAIIQARMGSTRLPGKVLKDLCGETVLARVVNRTRRATLLNKVVVATSVQPADDAILQECGRLSVACFRGDEADVLDRYYRAAEKFSADAIVRITSDCPLIDPEVSDKTIRAFLEQHPDYASNVLERRYPRGLDTEVMTFAALETARREARDPHQREHVTPFLYQHPERFRLVSVTGDRDYSHYRWTLDTVEDLEFLRSVYRRRAEASDPAWQDVLRILEREPDLAAINEHVKQKTS